MSTQRILAIVEREMRKYLRSPVLYSHNRPQIGLEVDNTDTFVSSALGESLSGLVAALNQDPNGP